MILGKIGTRYFNVVNKVVFSYSTGHTKVLLILHVKCQKRMMIEVHVFKHKVSIFPSLFHANSPLE